MKYLVLIILLMSCESNTSNQKELVNPELVLECDGVKRK